MRHTASGHSRGDQAGVGDQLQHFVPEHVQRLQVARFGAGEQLDEGLDGQPRAVGDPQGAEFLLLALPHPQVDRAAQQSRAGALAAARLRLERRRLGEGGVRAGSRAQARPPRARRTGASTSPSPP